MKIALASDLHLEFGPILFENEGADVLILSGDILVEADLGFFDARTPEGFSTKKSSQYHDRSNGIRVADCFFYVRANA